MLHKTKTILINAPKDKVFGYVADIMNLPKWANDFCQSVRRVGNDHIIQSCAGEMYFRIDSHAATGVVDLFAGPQKDMMICWPSRVMKLAENVSLLSITAQPDPGSTPEQFDMETAHLEQHLDNIRKAVE
ncbi:MAG: hypothetical protein A2516_06445 [Alphaproteobacteria bacterium RIFOXYD12_FULL_60_8]|nr:MAG: hypothetical protein A2516_06445 [Alphaproteobacteria bacterium RIFOXYD12_FULL_60_8]